MGRKRRVQPAPRTARWPLPALLLAVALVYGRLFFAGFVRFDDDLHVYANPFLNPPTGASLLQLWRHAYAHLYVPLAYTLYAALARLGVVAAHVDASIADSVSLSPAPFHVAAVALHAVNAWLCFCLVRQLTGRARPAWLCALLFALHPLQMESVGWISELRGVSSATLLLLALNAFVLARRARDQRRGRTLWLACLPLLAGAMLCKPSAAVAPLAALAIDRVALQTPWRRALLAAATWVAIVLPFVLLTHTLQGVSAAASSAPWQRPFIAGDALAFYVWKTALPIDLCVDYGRTPQLAMARVWDYLTWLVPVALLALAFRSRQRRPLAWLGGLLFVIFLLPTAGLVPFAYQAYSTVADRYAYLALMGAGLVLADVAEALELVRSAALVTRGAAVLFILLGAVAFAQSGHWLTSAALLRHTIAVNPAAAFAYNNLGDAELSSGDLTAALSDYQASAEHDPARAKPYVNLAEVYMALGRRADAEVELARAERAPNITPDDRSNLGVVLMKMNEPARALQALAAAVAADPGSPTYLFNQANALSAAGELGQAEAAFRRCIQLAPSLAGAHTGLGIVLAETGRLPEAAAEFRAALALRPDDAAALDDLKRAEGMLDRR
jgi:tetratricopeptide (TPR) repeat protein